MILTPRAAEIRHFHLYCGLGGGARGFNAARARVGHVEASFRCIGGVDVDAAAIRDFGRLAGVPGTVLDLFDREQYVAFHGKQPSDGWREVGPDAIRAAAGGERPHIIFTSAPCKGFSGLLNQARSASPKYQALNRLTVRGVFLALEAWADDPPEFFIFENVPRIATRGRGVLDEIVQLLAAYGYAVAETTHDCGELGGLAQSRKRFLLVARHRAKVPPFLYEPSRRPLRAVGEVLGVFPLPGAEAAGPMHRMRNLTWQTWVRLAFVEAGGDWRSLQKLAVQDGYLRDFAIARDAEYFPGVYGVTPWDRPSGVVTAAATPNCGRFSVADPRMEQSGEYGQLGVRRWDEPTGAVSGQSEVGGGRYAVADPRPAWDPAAYRNKLRVIPWDGAAGTITGAERPQAGAGAVADPRLQGENPKFNNVYRIVRWNEAAQAVTAGGGPSSGGQAVADPRSGLGQREPGADWAGAGHYGVVPWDEHSSAVTGRASHDNGSFSVADPRLSALDARVVAIIRALDGTWHRPFTTLELAALQGLVDPQEHLELDGLSDSGWRERIGNAVPSPTARAIAEVMGQTLLLAWAGETFTLSSQPIWVRPLVIGVTVDIPTEVM